MLEKFPTSIIRPTGFQYPYSNNNLKVISDTFCTPYYSSIHNNVHLKCGHESNPSLSRQQNWELRREEFQEADYAAGHSG